MAAITKILAVRVVMLSGAAIYLLLLSMTMLFVAVKGSMLWRADFLLQHGEPLLVAVFGAWCAYEAFMQLKRL